MSVASKTFTVPAGSPVFVATGVTRPNVLIVSRAGKVHTRVESVFDLEDGALQWAWFINRIRFPGDQLFQEGEKISVLYKL